MAAEQLPAMLYTDSVLGPPPCRLGFDAHDSQKPHRNTSVMPRIEFSHISFFLDIICSESRPLSCHAMSALRTADTLRRKLTLTYIHGDGMARHTPPSAKSRSGDSMCRVF